MRTSESSRLSIESQGLIFAVGTAVGWALLALALKAALLYASSGTIACFRLISAAAVMTVYYGLRGPHRLKVLIRPPRLGILAGLCLGINYFGYMKGIEFMGAGYAQIMIQLAPFSLALVGLVIFQEKPKLLQVIGILFTCLGFWVFYQSQSQLISVGKLESTNDSPMLLANIWLFIAAITWTVFASLQKWKIKNVAAQELNLLIYWIAGLLLLPLVQWQEIQSWSWSIWILMLGCGLNTIFAYGCLSEALQRAPASKVSVIISSNPLLTLLLLAQLAPFELFWLKAEPMQTQSYIGAGLVVLGVIFTFIRKK